MPFFSPYSYAGGVSRLVPLSVFREFQLGVFTCAFRLSSYGRAFPFARHAAAHPSDCAFLSRTRPLTAVRLAVPFSGLLTQRCMRLRSVAASFYQ